MWSVSSIIFDIVMDDLKEKVLNSLQFWVSAYFRYIDDVFMIALKDKVTQIFNSFNEQHDRFKFTVEYEEDQSEFFGSIDHQ